MENCFETADLYSWDERSSFTPRDPNSEAFSSIGRDDEANIKNSHSDLDNWESTARNSVSSTLRAMQLQATMVYDLVNVLRGDIVLFSWILRVDENY